MTGKGSYYYWKQLSIFVGLFFMAGHVQAVPFNVYDARTLGMGGVGIATGTHNAVFNNPALLTTVDEIHEWFLLLPAVVQEKSDSDDMENQLDTFQQAADALDLTNNASNRNVVQNSLNALDGSEYHFSNNTAVMLAIPGRILSGAFYLNSFEKYSAIPNIGGDDLLVPSYASKLAHRGFRVVENGVSAARALEAEKGWMSNMAIGFNAEFLLVEAYNYETSLRSAELKIDDSQGINGSQFQFDLGLLKEIGVWKIALVAKNLIAGKYKLSSTKDTLKIDPQLRAGFAYQSRQTVLELNIDLLRNKSVGYEPETQVAALGWEYRPKRFFALRAGFNQNLIETKASYFSSGIGLNVGGFYLDFAGYSGNEGLGMAGQLGFQF